MGEYDRIDERFGMFQRWEQSEHDHLKAVISELKDDIKELKADIKTMQNSYDAKITTLSEFRIRATVYASAFGVIGGIAANWLVKHI